MTLQERRLVRTGVWLSLSLCLCMYVSLTEGKGHVHTGRQLMQTVNSSNDFIMLHLHAQIFIFIARIRSESTEYMYVLKK